MRLTLFILAFQFLAGASSAQLLTEIPLTTNGYDNTAGVFDYLNGRLLVGGSGDFYSPQWGSTNGASLLISDDNGATHIREHVNWQDNPFDHGIVTAVEMIDGQTFLVGADHFNSVVRSIWRTADAGNTWVEVLNDDSGASPRWIYDIDCSGNECLAVGTGNKVFQSNDGGQSWTELIPNVNTFSINEVITPNGNDWFISTTSELIKYNPGSGFSTVFLPSRSVNRVVLSPDQSFLLTADDGWIYRTSDMGVTWDSTHVPTNRMILDAWTNGSTEFYAIDDDNKIFFSPTQGQYWYELITDADNLNQDLHFDNTSGLGYYSGAYKAYRIDSGFDNWIPLPAIQGLPDTMCVGESYTFNVLGDQNWTYNWSINGQQLSTDMNPTVEFQLGIANQPITLEVAANGNSNTLVFSNFVLLPSVELFNQPYLENDSLCQLQNGELVLPSNFGTTVYEIYNDDTLLAGPFVVDYQDEIFTSQFGELGSVEVRAFRSNPCGSLTTVVPIDYFIDIPIAESEVIVPERLCTGEIGQIVVDSRPDVSYGINSSNLSQGTGGIFQLVEIQYPGQYGPNYPFNIYAESDNGCSAVVGPFTIVHDSAWAEFSVESNCVVDTLVQYLNSSWGDSYLWVIDGAAQGDSSNLFSPQISYPHSGTYDLTLIVETDNGCRDSLTLSTNIYYQLDFITGIDTCRIDTLSIPFDSIIGLTNAARYAYDRITEHYIDELGNVYAIGCRFSSVGINYNGSKGPNAFIQKYDAQGVLLWEKLESRYSNGLSNNYDMSMATGVEVDPYGNLYVTGVHSASNSNVRMFDEIWMMTSNFDTWGWLAKISPNGDFQWIKQVPGINNTSSNNSLATDVLYENDGRILVCNPGYFKNIVVYDSAGTYISGIPFRDSGVNPVVHSSSNPSPSQNSAKMQIWYSPKLRKLSNGNVRLEGYFSDCSGVYFGSWLEGSGYVQAELAPDLSWEGGRFIISGNQFRTQCSDGFGMNLPSYVVDGQGNSYYAFNFLETFEIGGEQFDANLPGTALAKLNGDGDLLWLLADTITDNTPSVYSTETKQFFTGVHLLENNGGLLVSGNYFDFARFTASNGVFGQYKSWGSKRGRYLNRYDLNGNLTWSKHVSGFKDELNEYMFQGSSCGKVQFMDILSEPSTVTPNESVSKAILTIMSDDCLGSQNCINRMIHMLSSDQNICFSDTLILSADVFGPFDSLRWHVYNGVDFTPLFGSGQYEGETTEQLTLYDASGNFADSIFRLTGYFNSGSTINSGVVHLIPADTFDLIVNIHYSSCTEVEFSTQVSSLQDTVEIIVNNTVVGSIYNGNHSFDTELDTAQFVSFRMPTTCGYVYTDSVLVEPESLEITVQPQDVVVNEGSAFASFSVTGQNIDSYQWQESEDGVIWNDLQNSPSGVFGVTNSSMSLSGVSTISQRGGNHYRCHMVDYDNCEAYSNSAQLIVMTGIEESETVEYYLLPNPNNGAFEVIISDRRPCSLEIMEVTGRLIGAWMVSGRHFIETDLSAGTYLIQLKGEGKGKSIKRLIVQ